MDQRKSKIEYVATFFFKSMHIISQHSIKLMKDCVSSVLSFLYILLLYY